jgi:hypothetical protein
MVLGGILLCRVSGAPSPLTLRMANVCMHLALQSSHRAQLDQLSSKNSSHATVPVLVITSASGQAEGKSTVSGANNQGQRLLSAHTDYDLILRSTIDELDLSQLELLLSRGGNFLSTKLGDTAVSRILLLIPDADDGPPRH